MSGNTDNILAVEKVLKMPAVNLLNKVIYSKILTQYCGGNNIRNVNER